MRRRVCLHTLCRTLDHYYLQYEGKQKALAPAAAAATTTQGLQVESLLLLL